MSRDYQFSAFITSVCCIAFIRIGDDCLGHLRTKLMGLPSLNLWSPPSSTDVSNAEVGREEGAKTSPEQMQQDTYAELPYSITSSARASRAGGIVSPSALAVFRLMTSSNVAACSTGSSVGFSLLSILST